MQHLLFPVEKYLAHEKTLNSVGTDYIYPKQTWQGTLINLMQLSSSFTGAGKVRHFSAFQLHHCQRTTVASDLSVLYCSVEKLPNTFIFGHIYSILMLFKVLTCSVNFMMGESRCYHSQFFSFCNCIRNRELHCIALHRISWSYLQTTTIFQISSQLVERNERQAQALVIFQFL